MTGMNSSGSERDILFSEVDMLEHEKLLLLKQIQELELSLIQKKRESQNHNEQIAQFKKMISAFVSEEKHIQYEREFLELEKKELENSYSEILKRLDGNKIVLEEIISDIQFLKSEISTLKEKMILLEEEVPVRFRDSENLGQKITGTLVNSINDLYHRISVVDKKIKILYYKQENEL